MLEQITSVVSAGLALQDAGAQAMQGAGPPPNPFDMVPVGYFVGVCGFSLIAFAILIWIYILLTISMMKVPKEHQKMLPGLVWLNMIPCFNMVWSFFIASWIPASLDAALGARAEGVETGRKAGMIWAIFILISTLIGIIGGVTGGVMRAADTMRAAQTDNGSSMPVFTYGDYVPDMIQFPFMLVALIFLILFGTQVRNAARLLESN